MINTNKKYGFTGKAILLCAGRKIWPERAMYEIYALRDIPEHNVKLGDAGGYVESEDDLSQEDEQWIFPSDKAYGAKWGDPSRTNNHPKVLEDARRRKEKAERARLKKQSAQEKEARKKRRLAART